MQTELSALQCERIIQFCKDTGYGLYRSYSGRSMYGEHCFGIVHPYDVHPVNMVIGLARFDGNQAMTMALN